MTRVVGFGLFLLMMACGGRDGGSPTDASLPPPPPPVDAGTQADAATPIQDAAPPPVDDDAASPTPPADGGLGDLLTCKPEELNPLVECLTVICPMKGDIISQGTCLITDCVKQYEAISEKCRECVTAAIGQDVLAIIQSCVDTGAVLGDGGITLPF